MYIAPFHRPPSHDKYLIEMRQDGADTLLSVTGQNCTMIHTLRDHSHDFRKDIPLPKLLLRAAPIILDLLCGM